MEDFNNKSGPIFKNLDKSIFEKIDKFKLTPGYNNLLDLYNSLDEDQQKLTKALVLFLVFFIPGMLIFFLSWQNANLKDELNQKLSLISKASEIIGQKNGLVSVRSMVFSPNAIDGESMLTSKISGLVSSFGLDLSKIQISNYNGELSAGSVMRSEADFKFSNLSTEELMTLFSTLIKDKFRIQKVQIKRNAETNFLGGEFHVIHYGISQTLEED